MDYLTKPVRQQTVVDVLERAIREIDSERKKRSDNLRIQEKLETVIPIGRKWFRKQYDPAGGRSERPWLL